jgi:hypothetical protein
MTTIRSTEEAAVREVMAQLYAAWADNDADAFASLAAAAERFATWVFINQAGTWRVASYANCPAH